MREEFRGMGAAYLILLVSAIPGILLFWRADHVLTYRDRQRLETEAVQARDQAETCFREVSHVLHGLRGFFLASQEVNGPEWNLILDSVGFTESATGFRSLGFAIRVLPDELERHTLENRAVRKDYQVLPEGERPEYFPIIFFRDQEIGDVKALGWDPYSSEPRRAAMETSRDFGIPVATPRIETRLPWIKGATKGHVVYLPVFRDEISPKTLEERRKKLVGYVFAACRPEQLWPAILPSKSGLLEFEVFEEKGHRLYASGTNISELSIEMPVSAFGLKWKLRVNALKPFVNPVRPYALLGVFCGATAVSLTLFSLARAQAGARADAERMADQWKAAEFQLQAETERLAVTLRSIADGVITTDTSGRIVLLNRAAELITGWTQGEAEGRSLSEVFTILDEKTGEPLANPAKGVLADGGVAEAGPGGVLRGRDGVERFVAESAAAIRNQKGQVIGAALVFRDVTEKRRFERELLKASKLESVGLLAGGIAHDFNNILSIVMGNISFCRMMTPQAGPLNDRLQQAEKGCLRARELTQQLLTFAKGGAPIRKAVSITEIINESTAFAAHGSNVVCKMEAPPDLWAVEVDEGQMSQVFNNLVINAVQAMPDGGSLRIAMENLESHPRMTGRCVHITVQDTGPGIRGDHLGKIFDPYFSTKEGGSGLGLATTYAIIKKHQGLITVDSVEGQGSTFHIYLPATNAEPEPKAPAAIPASPGQGRVLVMDDESEILDLARASLSKMGYDVDVAADGVEAILKFESARNSGVPFDAVIMDLTVPGGMGGKEAMRRLREIDPRVRAIVSSGYSQDPVMANYREFGFAGVVEKPYQVEALARKLASVLGEG